MVKGKKYWLPIALGIVGIYYIIRSLKKTPSVMDSEGNIDTSSGGGTSSGGTTPASDFPLKKGSKGALVQRLQLAIGTSNLPKFGADGDFGTETQTALKAITGKIQVDSLAEIDGVAAKRGLVWSKTQYVPKLLAAPKNDPFGSYYYGQDPFKISNK
jgi:hypothetical protein